MSLENSLIHYIKVLFEENAIQDIYLSEGYNKINEMTKADSIEVGV